jgi:hypothetical protein
MPTLTFLVVFLVFLAITASLFLTAWRYGRRFASKSEPKPPDPGAGPDDD